MAPWHIHVNGKKGPQRTGALTKPNLVKPAPARPRGIQVRAPIGVRCPIKKGDSLIEKAFSTDEDDQDGKFFLNHPEEEALRRLGAPAFVAAV